MKIKCWGAVTAVLTFALLLASCGGGGGGGGTGINPAPTYSISGSVSGLNGTVVLQDNGVDDLSVSANGAFTFVTMLADGAAYNITVKTHPVGQACTASSNTGTIAGANVANISIVCAPSWTKQLGVSGQVTYTAGVAVDPSGNVYVAGYTSGDLDSNTPLPPGTQDAFVTKYDSSGNKMYTRQLGVSGENTIAAGVAVDSSGNVYVAGYTTGDLDGNTPLPADTYNSFVTTYTSTGGIVRTRQLGVSGQDTKAYGVAVDSSGNVYVAGYTDGVLQSAPTGTTDFFVTKYDSSGTMTYTRQLGVSGESTYATGVAVDSGGNVYVAGYTSGVLDSNTSLPTDTKDAFVTKYDSLGNKLPTKQLGVSGKFTYATGVAVDSSDNVYVAGYTSGGLDGNTPTGFYDFFVTVYDSAGNKLRTRQLGVSGQYTVAAGVAVDSSDSVYVAGSTTGGLDGNTLTGASDFFVTKYDSAGNKVRTRQLGVSGKDTGATGVAVDSSDHVYVAGSTTGGLDGNTHMGSTYDSFVTKYDSAGNKQTLGQ